MTTTEDTDTAYERLARLEKSIALCDLLDALGWDHMDAAFGTPEAWAVAADLAGVRKPSKATCALVADLLRQRQQARELVAERKEPVR